MSTSLYFHFLSLKRFLKQASFHCSIFAKTSVRMGWFRVESTIVLVCVVAVFVEGQVSLSFIDSANDPCRSSTGARAKCIDSRSCPARFTSSSLNKICGFAPSGVRICCPETDLQENKTGALSESKEVSPPSISLDCGRKELTPIGSSGSPTLSTIKRRRKRSGSLFSFIRDRMLKNSKLKLPRRRKRNPEIAGGIISLANSWPWMVLLGKRRGSSNLFFCGGALINKFYVLTAAHCVLDPEPFFVRLGEHGITNANLPSKREDIEIANVTFHPSYALGLGYHDIALVQLAKPVTFRREVKPVCLPWGKTGTENLTNQTVTLTGWGAETYGGTLSPILREVKVKVFESFECQKSYATLPDFTKSFPKGMSKDNVVCAGETQGGKDSCQGDSGGPMVHEGQNGRYTLAGVISKGYGCGKVGFPGIYAPLRHYDTLQWIKNVAF